MIKDRQQTLQKVDIQIRSSSITLKEVLHHHEGFATLYLAVKQRYWCRVTRRSGAHSAPRKIANSVTTCPDDAIRARRQPSRRYDPHR